MPINYTRAQLEGFLRSGQSVLVNGRHIDRPEDLPPESELAAGDRERARAALEAHDDQIARLVAERRKLAQVAEGRPESPPPGSQSAQPAPPPPAEQQRAEQAPPPADEPPPPPREEDERPGMFGKRKK